MGSLAVSRFSMPLAMMDHDNLEKMNFCVNHVFSFLSFLGVGLCLADVVAAGAPL